MFAGAKQGRGECRIAVDEVVRIEAGADDPFGIELRFTVVPEREV